MGNFIVKCRLSKVDESGISKKVSETYLVDAMSCTEAEARVYDKLSPFTSDMKVTSVLEKKNVEILAGDSDNFYLAKTAYITLDEKTAKEVKTIMTYYVNASTFKEAYDRISEELRKSVVDTEILSLSKTNVIEYYGSEI